MLLQLPASKKQTNFRELNILVHPTDNSSQLKADFVSCMRLKWCTWPPQRVGQTMLAILRVVHRTLRDVSVGMC